MSVSNCPELIGMEGNFTTSPVGGWQQHMSATKLDTPWT